MTSCGVRCNSVVAAAPTVLAASSHAQVARSSGNNSRAPVCECTPTSEGSTQGASERQTRARVSLVANTVVLHAWEALVLVWAGNSHLREVGRSVTAEAC